MRRELVACAFGLACAGCGGDESGATRGGGGSAATAGASGGGGQAASGGGGTAGTAATAGSGASGGTGAVPPVDGGGGTPSQVPSYDVNAAKRAGCQFGSGLKTTDTIGPQVPHGDALPFEHIVVLMMENRSFDHYFSSLPAYGVTDVDVASPTDSNPDPTTGKPVQRYHETRYCIEDVNHEWDGTHTQYNAGAMDGFVTTNNPGGARAMGYYTDKDLPFYYWASKTFSMSDRHFCSLLGPTWPNRFFFYGATSWGNIHTGTIDPITSDTFYKAPKITDQLKQAGRSWKIYRDGATSFAVVWGLSSENIGVHTTEFYKDVQADALPHVSIIDPNFLGAGQNDEHPPANIQLGQQFVSNIYQAIASNPTVWKKTVLIVFYDEHGGFYDHVPPPEACEPDNLLPPTNRFDRLGIRTPLFIMSPFNKAGYVSHLVTDITSVTRFIQNRFDLPSLTKRDSNAWPMLDMFDFANPPFVTPPSGAPSAAPDPAGVTWCTQNPPGTGLP